MLYVTTLEEAAAATAAGVHMLSIEGRFFSEEMREAAGDCFVQVGLPCGPFGKLATAEDYLREAFRFMAVGGDCLYCAASLDIQRALCDNAVPVVAHVGLIPSQNTWTGGFKAVGKTAESAKAVWDHVKWLEAIGCFGAELEFVPDRVAEWAAFVHAVTTGGALPVTLDDGVNALAIAEAATRSAKTGSTVDLASVLG